MCTVTFLPRSNDDFVLTSNRDEAPGRDTFPPKTFVEDGVELLYPKDAVAGGTWIGVSQKQRAVTLMNGGFTNHQRKPFYRKSRGLVVKDFMKSDNFIDEAATYDFNEIEPFTAILVDWNTGLRLFQLVWDSSKIHFTEMPLAPRIWSSAPLYPEDIKKKREQWFSEFLFETVKPSNEELLHFHKTAGEGNPMSDLIMDRGFIKTKSISQIIGNKNRVLMRYEDLQSSKVTISEFDA